MVVVVSVVLLSEQANIQCWRQRCRQRGLSARFPGHRALLLTAMRDISGQLSGHTAYRLDSYQVLQQSGLTAVRSYSWQVLQLSGTQTLRFGRSYSCHVLQPSGLIAAMFCRCQVLQVLGRHYKWQKHQTKSV